MNNCQEVFEKLRYALITILVMPVLTISCIYINYGYIFDKYLERPDKVNKIYHLKTHFDFFNKDIAFSTLKQMPLISIKLGYYAIITIYCLFFLWMLLHGLSTLIKLHNIKGSRILMIVETFLLIGFFGFSVIPGLSIWLSIFSLLYLSAILVLILLYWYVSKYRK